MIFGVDYYPEQWPEARWAVDAKQMRTLGLQVVRIAEFAWSKIEPVEGVFDWGWLDRAIATLATEGLQVVLGTPTAAPPAWLSRRYPDTLPVDEQGHRRNFGGRRHYCPNNPRFQDLSLRVVAGMAERYTSDLRVIGWQIDNEFGDGNTARCYCPNCAAAFRLWLQERYCSLDALNAAWGTVFWSQTYDEWSQIDLPNLTLTPPNPSHALDFYRFASNSYVAFQGQQVEILRGAKGSITSNQSPAAGTEKASGEGRQFITHNFMGLFSDLDQFRLAEKLDFASWDSYPTGHDDRWRTLLYPPGSDTSRNEVIYAYDVGDPMITAMAHDLTRGLMQAPFWIMEQQCGQINWGMYNPDIRPGTLRLWIWHALACGASAIIFFRWRATLFAQEQYHSGLLTHDAMPDTGFTSLQDIQAERTLMEKLAALPLQPSVALLLDFEDLWALELQPHRRDFSYLRHLFVFYHALTRLGLQVDIVHPQANLRPYRLVIAPSAHLADNELETALARVARRGGTLLLGVRSGFKTRSNLVTEQPLPGALRYISGSTITDWHALPPDIHYNIQSEIPGLSGEAAFWAEAIRPPFASSATKINEASSYRSLAKYASGPFEGRTALGEHDYGTGRVVQLGWYPTQAQAEALLRHLAAQLNLPVITDLPAGLIVTRRGPYTMLLNFTDQALSVQVEGQVATVAARDVKIIEPAELQPHSSFIELDD